MGPPSTGRVVLVPFPFSDLSQTKVRPAVCLVPVGRGDWVLCQITSKSYGDPAAIPIATGDFAAGGLTIPSFARPGKLFTADSALFIRSLGLLKPDAYATLLSGVAAQFQPPPTT